VVTGANSVALGSRQASNTKDLEDQQVVEEKDATGEKEVVVVVYSYCMHSN
jgi:hypothetical protein